MSDEFTRAVEDSLKATWLRHGQSDWQCAKCLAVWTEEMFQQHANDDDCWDEGNVFVCTCKRSK